MLVGLVSGFPERPASASVSKPGLPDASPAGSTRSPETSTAGGDPASAGQDGSVTATRALALPDRLQQVDYALFVEGMTLRNALLEWIYNLTVGDTSEVVDLDEFLTGHGLDFGQGVDLVSACEEDYLIERVDSGLGKISVTITLTGIDYVLERRKRRTTPPLLRAAARNNLLRWLYEQDAPGVRWPRVPDFLRTDLSLIDGRPLTEEEVGRAAEYLVDCQLINGDQGYAEGRGPLTAEIRPEGQECIEQGGDVMGYLEDRSSGGPADREHQRHPRYCGRSQQHELHAERRTQRGLGCARRIRSDDAPRAARPGDERRPQGGCSRRLV